MNEHLIERFGRGKASRDSHVPSGLTARPPATLNLSIREYAKAAEQPADSSHWTAFREIPSSDEVFDRGRTEHDTALELAENTIVGPYTSKEEYLETHYRLLREDAVAVCIPSMWTLCSGEEMLTPNSSQPLRDVVSEIQVYPHLMEKDSDNDAYIYEKVPQIA